jgi:hypothetical protein
VQFSPPSCHFISLRSKYSPLRPVLKHRQSVCFPKPRTCLKQSHFESLEDIRGSVTTRLDTLSENDSKQCLQASQIRRKTCINWEWVYSVRNHIL